MAKFTALTVLVFVTGCANVNESFFNRQVVEDQLITDKTGEHELGTLAVTAQRRMVIANLKTGKFCAEPPPEAADAVTSAIAAALNANVTGEGNASAEIASNFARHVNQLYKRAHTIQMFRDASFHLCVNAVNSSDQNTDAYDSYRESVLSMVTELKPTLEKEIYLYYKTEQERAKNPPSLGVVVCNATASSKSNGDAAGSTLGSSITCQPISSMPQNRDTTAIVPEP